MFLSIVVVFFGVRFSCVFVEGYRSFQVVCVSLIGFGWVALMMER